jgi:hypothetical protein
MGGRELRALGDEEGFEGVHPLSGQGRDGENLEARVDLHGLASGSGGIERKVGEEIRFGQDEDMGGQERLGVFLRLVVPLGRGQEDEAQGFAEVVARRADQVPDVLDEQEVQVGRDFGQNLARSSSPRGGRRRRS